MLDSRLRMVLLMPRLKLLLGRFESEVVDAGAAQWGPRLILKNSGGWLGPMGKHLNFWSKAALP